MLVDPQKRVRKKRDGLSKNDRRAYGRVWYAENKERLLAVKRDWRARNNAKARQIVRRSAIKRVHGITLEHRDRLLSQHKCCPVCHSDNRRRVLDHCHTCGEHRSVLCCNCNSALGLAGDSPSTLRALADYLEKHKCEP